MAQLGVDRGGFDPLFQAFIEIGKLVFGRDIGDLYTAVLADTLKMAERIELLQDFRYFCASTHPHPLPVWEG